MNNYELYKTREVFSQLFVIAIKNKMNLDSFTFYLERSDLVLSTQKDIYSSKVDNNLKDLFYMITNYEVSDIEIEGIYNDAYWAGLGYFDLQQELKIPFSLLFLKLPLSKMLDIYSIYHEMDISSLVSYFISLNKEKTILRILCENKKCSLNDICKKTNIKLSTLKKYNESDSHLYSASFQNINKLVNYFNTTYSLFVN